MNNAEGIKAAYVPDKETVVLPPNILRDTPWALIGLHNYIDQQTSNLHGNEKIIEQWRIKYNSGRV